mgnify:CR=1 FL=1
MCKANRYNKSIGYKAAFSLTFLLAKPKTASSLKPFEVLLNKIGSLVKQYPPTPGLGSGIVSNGKLIEGYDGFAAEFTGILSRQLEEFVRSLLRDEFLK